jgi:hypothetical protein
MWDEKGYSKHIGAKLTASSRRYQVHEDIYEYGTNAILLMVQGVCVY